MPYDTPFTRTYTPPKPFNQGGWNYNAGNPLAQFGMAKTAAPATGSTWGAPQTSGGMVRTPAPVTGESWAPAAGNTDFATSQPFGARTMNTQTGAAFMDGNPVGMTPPSLPNQDIQEPMPQFNAPMAMPGFTAPGMQTQYGTVGNIQEYMNPYLDQIIDRGNRNIMAQASARGQLGSTGTTNQLGEWAGQAQADAFNDAFSRFATDRGYMTDAYRDSRNFDYGNFRDENNWQYGLFSDERDDYNQRMRDWYNANQGVVNTGIGAAGNAGIIQGDLGRALAMLYGNRGDVGANQAINQGGINQGGMDSLFSLLSLLGQGGGG